MKLKSLWLMVAAWAGVVASTPLVHLNGELPNRAGSIKLAVTGDNGIGKRPQYEVADQMATARRIPWPSRSTTCRWHSSLDGSRRRTIRA